MSFTFSRFLGQLLLIALFVEPAGAQGTEVRFVQLPRPVESELRLGQMFSKSFERRVVMNANPALLTLVDRVAQQLSRNSRSPIPIVARVIESSDVNVITLPGGHVYVTSGLVRTAGTEAELAWAIAHGIASVSSPDFPGLGFAGTSGRTFLWDRSGTFIDTSSQLFSGGLLQSSGMLAALRTSMSNRERHNLEEADSLGLEYLYKAGYDPRASVSLFQKVEAISDAKVPTKDASGAFLTHPPLSHRIKRMESAVRKLQSRDRYILTTQEFDDVHSRLAF